MSLSRRDFLTLCASAVCISLAEELPGEQKKPPLRIESKNPREISYEDIIKKYGFPSFEYQP